MTVRFISSAIRFPQPLNTTRAANLERRILTFRITGLINVVFLLVASMSAQVGASGTANHLPLWTSTTNLGNSVVIQSNGHIGIGSSSPAAILDVTGKAGTNNTNGGNAPTAALTWITRTYGVSRSWLLKCPFARKHFIENCA